MDFHNAVTMMQQGIKMTRTSWENQKEYIYLDGAIFMKKCSDIRNPFPIIFFSHEILATDWEVVRQTPT